MLIALLIVLLQIPCYQLVYNIYRCEKKYFSRNELSKRDMKVRAFLITIVPIYPLVYVAQNSNSGRKCATAVSIIFLLHVIVDVFHFGALYTSITTWGIYLSSAITVWIIANRLNIISARNICMIQPVAFFIMGNQIEKEYIYATTQNS